MYYVIMFNVMKLYVLCLMYYVIMKPNEIIILSDILLFKIQQRGVQWKQGAVAYVIL